MALEETYSRDSLPAHTVDLDTERLRLTPMKPHHEQEFWEMRSDAEVMRFIPLDIATDRDAHRLEFQKDIQEGKRFKFGFAVEWIDQPDKCIGWSIARPTQDGKYIEIGYWIHRSAWGKGLATELTRELVSYCEDEMGWPKEDLMATVTIGNQASRHVLEKSGFQVTHEEMADGELCWYFRRA